MEEEKLNNNDNNRNDLCKITEASMEQNHLETNENHFSNKFNRKQL